MARGFAAGLLLSASISFVVASAAAVSSSAAAPAVAPPASRAPTAAPEAAPPPGYRVSDLGAWRWAATGGGAPAPALERFIDERFASVRARLGLAGPRSPLFVDAFDRAAYRSAVRHYGGAEPQRWQIAIAFPARGVVVLDGAALSLGRAGTYAETLTHEIVHLVAASAGPRVPRWYHEGLAQWLSGAYTGGAAFQRTASLAARDALMSFDEVDRYLPETHEESSAYYE